MQLKLLVAAFLIIGYGLASQAYLNYTEQERVERAVDQLGPNAAEAHQRDVENSFIRNNSYVLGWAFIALLVFCFFVGNLKNMQKALSLLLILAVLSSSGCRKPFEPVKLEVVESNEVAFLIPFQGKEDKQKVTQNEEFLRSNMIYTQQIKIPQQWVPVGYETFGYNGAWHDAARLIKVNTKPVTREWTADKESGTSAKNEAIWVMTADQVEFSTGWTITARIPDRDSAVKFLHNYPNGSLDHVLDSEVRAKLQAEFGLEVTDLPMDTLRKAATPHITKVVKVVIDFFDKRGIQITNLGITGGFVYKDRSIVDTMVKVFNAEQEKSIAVAKTNAQTEMNKAVVMKSTGEADAILKTRKAEADGIKLVADARLYELEKAAQQLEAYVKLKQLELQKELLAKWDGQFPKYFMGTGGAQSPQMLLQLPALEASKK